jgi:hypothetical protein
MAVAISVAAACWEAFWLVVIPRGRRAKRGTMQKLTTPRARVTSMSEKPDRH